MSEDTRIEPGWFQDRWKGEDREGTNWEDARVKRDDPEGVIAGLQRMRRGPEHPHRIKLLDGGNRGRSEILPAIPVGVLPAPGDLLPQGFDQAITLLEVDGTSNDGQRATVTLHGPSSILPVGTTVVRALALVEMGNDGTSLVQRAEVDLVNGVSFTVGGGFIRISGVNLSFIAAGGHISLVMGAYISRYPVGAGGITPQRTLYRDAALAAAGTQEFPIPPFAKAVRVVREPIGTSFDVHVRGVTGGANQYSAGVVVGGQMDPLPLSGDARIVEVDNTGIAAMTLTKVIYDLAL